MVCYPVRPRPCPLGWMMPSVPFRFHPDTSGRLARGYAQDLLGIAV